MCGGMPKKNLEKFLKELLGVITKKFKKFQDTMMILTEIFEDIHERIQS